MVLRQAKGKNENAQSLLSVKLGMQSCGSAPCRLLLETLCIYICIYECMGFMICTHRNYERVREVPLKALSRDVLIAQIPL